MQIDTYKHLSKDDKVPFSIEDTAKLIDGLNYGSQRYLAALVNHREAHPDYEKYECHRDNTQKLRELLEKGWF